MTGSPALVGLSGPTVAVVRDTCIGGPVSCAPQNYLASVSDAGDPANLGVNGRYVAFASLATNLVLGDPGPLNNFKDIFVRDTCQGAPSPCVPTTLWASIAQLPGDPYTPSYSDSDYPAISADGHYVAFISNSGTKLAALNLTGGATAQVFIAKTGF